MFTLCFLARACSQTMTDAMKNACQSKILVDGTKIFGFIVINWHIFSNGCYRIFVKFWIHKFGISQVYIQIVFFLDFFLSKNEIHTLCHQRFRVSSWIAVRIRLFIKTRIVYLDPDVLVGSVFFNEARIRTQFYRLVHSSKIIIYQTLYQYL